MGTSSSSHEEDPPREEEQGEKKEEKITSHVDTDAEAHATGLPPFRFPNPDKTTGIREEDVVIYAENFNLLRSWMGMGPVKYLDEDETEEEEEARKKRNKAAKDLEREERKDEIEMDGEDADYDAILFNSELPETWKMMMHIVVRRKAIKTEVAECIEDDEHLRDGTYGCPVCRKAFFSVKDGKLLAWSKAEFKQIMVCHHGDNESLGLSCRDECGTGRVI